MIRVRLSEAMRAFEERTGARLTYADLAAMTGIARATIESIATRRSYNPTLRTVDRLCDALGVTPDELLEFKPGRARARQATKRGR